MTRLDGEMHLAVLAENLLYISGLHAAKITEKTPLSGKVGDTLNTEQGKECVRAVIERLGRP